MACSVCFGDKFDIYFFYVVTLLVYAPKSDGNVITNHHFIHETCHELDVTMKSVHKAQSRWITFKRSNAGSIVRSKKPSCLIAKNRALII